MAGTELAKQRKNGKAKMDGIPSQASSLSISSFAWMVTTDMWQRVCCEILSSSLISIIFTFPCLAVEMLQIEVHFQTFVSIPENLSHVDVPQMICHPAVPLLFDEFCDTHYRPNQQLNRLFPEDFVHTASAAPQVHATPQAENDGH